MQQITCMGLHTYCQHTTTTHPTAKEQLLYLTMLIEVCTVRRNAAWHTQRLVDKVRQPCVGIYTVCSLWKANRLLKWPTLV